MRWILLAALSLVTVQSLLAQPPQSLNYQAVARDASGSVLSGRPIQARISILDGSVGGTTVYSETHTLTTNTNTGLFALAIGKGTVVSGSFSGIDWGSADKFLKVELSTDGGSSYSLQGINQFLSVPYALYAQRTNLQAGNGISITGGNTIAATYTGTNGVAVTGSTISGAYTGANGVAVSGGTISGAYTGANGVAVSGGNISGAYTGTNGVTVSGNTISGSYQAGTGVSIVGNTISVNSAAGKWATDANGINYRDASTFGYVGIAAPSINGTALKLLQRNVNGAGSAALDINSLDTWQTVIVMNNQVLNRSYQFNLGGSINTGMPVGSLGIFNASLGRWVLNTDGTNNNYVAVGSTDTHARVPKSRLHIMNGDLNLEDVNTGIIMKSPNGQCWRITVANGGALVRTAITCP